MKLSVKSFIGRNIRNLFIAFMLLFIFVGILTVPALPTMINLIFAPFALDYDKAFVAGNLENIDGISSAAKLAKRKVDVQARNAYNYSHPYRQDGKYKFYIKPIAVYETGLVYQTTYFIQMSILESPPSPPEVTHKYIILDVGDALVITKVAPDFKIKRGQTFSGSFLPLQLPLVEDLKIALGEKTRLQKVFTYELDTLVDFSSDEIIDVVLFLVPYSIAFILGIVLIIYKTNFKAHPTYRRLVQMNADPTAAMASIDADLSNEAAVVKKKNTYTTEHWIITRGFFKTRFAKIKLRSRFDE